MYCSKCGTQIDNDSVFCKACGNKMIKNDDFSLTNNTSNTDSGKERINKNNSKSHVIAVVSVIGLIVITIVISLIISNRTYIGGWINTNSNNNAEFYSCKINYNNEFVYMTNSLEKYNGSWHKVDESKDVIIANCNGQVITISYNRFTDTITFNIGDSNNQQYNTVNFRRNDNLEW